MLIPTEPASRPPGTQSLRSGYRRASDFLAPWLIGTVAVCWLYFGRSVLIPITLAVVLSFLLAPAVALLRRTGLPRTPAIFLAILLGLGGLGGMGAVIVSQASTLAKDAPAYAERIASKASSVREDLQNRFGFLTRQPPPGGGHPLAKSGRQKGSERLTIKTDAEVVPVEVRDPGPTALQEIRTLVLPALAPVETALIVLIVTIFILFQKEDLRDRLIRVMGSADLHRSTVALDEGAKRLSRYFLSQFVVNCGFGAVIWLGLYLLGVPSPGLWGILAGLLRFVPYVGPIVAAAGPLALSAAIDPGWTQVTCVALLFVIVEPIIGYALEPMIYGHSTGLSPVSVVVAALFWTWIWGPIGLVLAMPITLMLVVLGRHVPAFAFFDIVLGDRPALSPSETFYQRVLAGHADDALDQAEELLETETLAAYYDEVVLPGLRLAAADVDRGAVERSSMWSVCAATNEMLSALADYSDAAPNDGADAGCGEARDLAGRSVICFCGPGPLDAAVCAMAAQVMRRRGCEVREDSRSSLRGDAADSFDPGNADTICILGLFDHRSAARMRRVAALIEQRFPRIQLIVGVQRKPEEYRVDATEAPVPRTISDVATILISTPPDGSSGPG